jgi:hypothetical protein
VTPLQRIRCEQRAIDRAGMALERSERLAVAVPQPRGAVSRRGQDAVAVLRELRAGYLLGVALEGGNQPIVAVPQPRRVVIRGGQDAAAVGSEHRAVDRAGVLLEGRARAGDSAGVALENGEPAVVGSRRLDRTAPVNSPARWRPARS